MNTLETTAPVGQEVQLQTTNSGPLSVSVGPPAGGGASAAAFQASVTDTNNNVPTSANYDFQAIPTAEFQQSAASSAFTFAAAGCVATCTRAGRFVVRVLCCLQNAGAGIATFAVWSGCVDKSGDVVGTPTQSQFGNGEQFVLALAAPLVGFSFSGAFERVVELAIGDTVQPAFGEANFPGNTPVDLDVLTLTMTIEAVP
jgi:hypothetical protein